MVAAPTHHTRLEPGTHSGLHIKKPCSGWAEHPFIAMHAKDIDIEFAQIEFDGSATLRRIHVKQRARAKFTDFRKRCAESGDVAQRTDDHQARAIVDVLREIVHRRLYEFDTLSRQQAG